MQNYANFSYENDYRTFIFRSEIYASIRLQIVANLQKTFKMMKALFTCRRDYTIFTVCRPFAAKLFYYDYRH